MRGWGTCEAYEKESSRLVADRAAEDGSGGISAEAYTPGWIENDPRALEFERQKEDYLELAEKLSVFLDGGAESESEEVYIIDYETWRLCYVSMIPAGTNPSDDLTEMQTSGSSGYSTRWGTELTITILGCKEHATTHWMGESNWMG